MCFMNVQVQFLLALQSKNPVKFDIVIYLLHSVCCTRRMLPIFLESVHAQLVEGNINTEITITSVFTLPSTYGGFSHDVHVGGKMTQRC